MIAYAMMTKDMAVKMSRMNEGIAAISNTIVEFVTGIAVVKTFGQDKQSHSRYRDAAKAFAVSYEGWVRPMLRTEALASIALSAPVVLVVNLGLGSWFGSLRMGVTHRCADQFSCRDGDSGVGDGPSVSVCRLAVRQPPLRRD